MTIAVPLGVILYLAVIWLTMQAARERYRNPVLWGFLAVWVSVLALVPLLLLGKSKAGLKRHLEASERERQRAHIELEAEEEARLRARARFEADG